MNITTDILQALYKWKSNTSLLCAVEWISQFCDGCSQKSKYQGVTHEASDPHKSFTVQMKYT